MLTFLQWLMEQSLGPPVKHGAPGQSYWPCPYCGPGIHVFTLPHKPPYPDRFRCEGNCDWWGDVWGFMRFAYPHEFWRDHQARMPELEEAYRQECATPRRPTPTHTPTRNPPLPQGERSSQGREGRINPKEAERVNRALQNAWADMTTQQRERLLRLAAHAANYGVSLDDLAKYAADFREWKQQTDEMEAKRNHRGS
jgi:hypothetical protein